MRKKGKKKEEAESAYEKLWNKMHELKDNVLEEFDMLELIEDSIKDVFDCNLNCATCSAMERGKCMQDFKKGNLYWLRKIAQDEEMIRNIVEKMSEMEQTLTAMMKETTKYSEQHRTPEEKFEEHTQQVKKKLDDKPGYSFYS